MSRSFVSRLHTWASDTCNGGYGHRFRHGLSERWILLMDSRNSPYDVRRFRDEITEIEKAGRPT